MQKHRHYLQPTTVYHLNWLLMCLMYHLSQHSWSLKQVSKFHSLFRKGFYCYNRINHIIWKVCIFNDVLAMTELLKISTIADFIIFCWFFGQKRPFLRTFQIAKFQIAILCFKSTHNMKQNIFLHRIQLHLPEQCKSRFLIEWSIWNYWIVIFWHILCIFVCSNRIQVLWCPDWNTTIILPISTSI